MDLVSILLLISTVGITIVFIIFYNIFKNKKNKKYFAFISKQAAEQGCKISEFEHENSFIIGIDYDSQFVFFYDTRNQSKININLSEIQQCKVNHLTRSIGSGKNIHSTTDRVELIFVHKDRKKTDIILECYNSNYSTQLANELIIADKWLTIITNELKK